MMLGPQVVAQQHAELGNSVQLNDRCHNRGRPQRTLIPHSKAKSKQISLLHSMLTCRDFERKVTPSMEISPTVFTVVSHIQKSNALSPWTELFHFNSKQSQEAL